jgi:hypothetical protein
MKVGFGDFFSPEQLIICSSNLSVFGQGEIQHGMAGRAASCLNKLDSN